MTQKRSALGRGLGALLQNSETDITSKSEGERIATAGSISLIDISKIEANPFQPRTNFEKEALYELVESIKLHGIIQPITLRKMGYDKYQIISGERRFRASQISGLTQIPAYIRVANDQAMLELALVENIQRAELDPIEIALSYKRLIDECSLTQEQLSEKVSKQRSTIANFLRLLKLPAEIQLALRDRLITMGHAKAIVNIDKPETQLEIFNKIVAESLSVREVEDIARWQNKKPDALQKVKKSKISLGEEYQAISGKLSAHFNSKAKLTVNNKGKGKIVIPFKSDADLKNIIDKIGL